MLRPAVVGLHESFRPGYETYPSRSRCCHKLSAEVEALAQVIAVAGASRRRLELALPIAEAHIEISRVAQAMHNLLERSLVNPTYFSPKDAHKPTTALIRLIAKAAVKDNPFDWQVVIKRE